MTLLADVKPAVLRTADGKTHGNLRVFIWPDRVEAYGADGKTAVLRYASGVTSIDTGRSPQAPARSRPWTLLTAEGEWKVERGCGCSGGVPAALATMSVPGRVDA